MDQTFRHKKISFRLFTSLGFILLLTSCSNAVPTISELRSRIENSEIILSVEKSVLKVGQATKFEVSGGRAPYSFSVIEGGGGVDDSGNYVAPAMAGTTVIQVKDSVGKTAQVTMAVIEELQLLSSNSLNLFFAQSQTFSATGGVLPYTYSIVSGGGTINSSTGAFVATAPEGTTKVRVTDASGDSSEINVSIEKAVVTIVSPTEGSYIKSEEQSAFTITGQCANNGWPVAIEVVNILTQTPVTALCLNGGYQHDFNFSNIDDGNIKLRVTQEGATAVQVGLVKDTQNPNLGISSPISNLAYSSSFSFNGSCSENNKPVKLIVNQGSISQDFQVTCNDGAFASTINLAAFADGAFTIAASAKDVAGNETMITVENLTKDSVVPESPLSLKVNSDFSSLTETPFISWGSAIDANTGVSKYIVSIYKESGALISQHETTTNSLKVKSLSLVDSTKYRVRVVAIDAAGNESLPSEFSPQWIAKDNPCPINYLLVSSPAGGTNSSFCVAKYEMKLGVGGLPASVPTGLPLLVPRDTVTLEGTNFFGAIDACQSLGAKYKLISNQQWNVVARNIASVASNWSDEEAYKGYLNRGHHIGEPGTALPASTNDSDVCSGISEDFCTVEEWDISHRTHKLSNGSTIWDFSGNVAEWVVGSTGENDTTGFVSTFSPTSPMRARYGTDMLCDDPDDDDELYCGYGQAVFIPNWSDAIARGGMYELPSELSVQLPESFPDALDYNVNGIFSAFLGVDPQLPGMVGFRCIFDPY